MVLDVADHQGASCGNQQGEQQHHQHRHVHTIDTEILQRPHRTGHHTGSGRTGQTDEVALVDLADLGIESGQTQGGAGRIDEGNGQTDIAQAGQCPLVGQQRGRQAEGNHVRQRVVLGTKSALGIGHARHTPVETVQHHGHEDGDRGNLVLAIHGTDD
ncbi:hypothetical protein D3C85_1113260 [compost metagenome]